MHGSIVVCILSCLPVFKVSSASNQLVSWDEAVRRCNTSSDEPLYLPGFSDEEFQATWGYMNKHQIPSMWINLKHRPVFVWNNESVYSEKIDQAAGDCGSLIDKKVRAVNCATKRPFICQGYSSGDQCKKKVTWDEAETYCKKHGGAMLMDHTRPCFSKHVGGQWIGLKKRWRLKTVNQKNGTTYSSLDNISKYCDIKNVTTSCALMTRTRDQDTYQCKFVSCEEKHSYICSANITKTGKTSRLGRFPMVLLLPTLGGLVAILLAILTLVMSRKNQRRRSKRALFPEVNMECDGYLEPCSRPGYEIITSDNPTENTYAEISNDI